MSPASLWPMVLVGGLAGLALGCNDGGTEPSDHLIPDLLVHAGAGNDTRIQGIRLADGAVLFTLEGNVAAWSPDGQLISFIDGLITHSLTGISHPGPLTLATPFGGKLDILSEIGGVHAWSPDGTKIAVGYSETGANHAHHSVHVINTDGSGQLMVANGAMVSHWAPPCWSPDSRQFLAGWWTTSIVNADGTGTTVLEGGGHGSSWSPDGSSIAFWAPVHDDWEGVPTSRSEIFLIAPAGGSRTQLTNSVTPGARLAESTDPSWSPDGTRIAFVRSIIPEATFPHGYSHLYVMKADGSDARRIGAHDVWGRAVWSPDGTRIAYTSNDQVRVVNVDGTGDAYVAAGRFPAWRPTPSRP